MHEIGRCVTYGFSTPPHYAVYNGEPKYLNDKETEATLKVSLDLFLIKEGLHILVSWG